MSWFKQLFGFHEADYDKTRGEFVVEGTTLRSLANGRSFSVGQFSTPTLASLREQAQGLLPGRLKVTHEAIGDVLELHAMPENRGAMFQVASQFNCLEFVGPSIVPEDGVTGYAHDPTQGPACSLAAAAATVYRNYYAQVDGHWGQTHDRQIDTIDSLAEALGGLGRYWDVRNGYVFSSEARLQQLAKVIAHHDRDALLGQVKIGLHTNVGVTFASRFKEPKTPTYVSQAFCSAISCGYTSLPLGLWEPLATLVLDAIYEATLLAAVIDAAQGKGSGVVWLTLVGGGAFGNRREWIGRAIGRALKKMENTGLDVRIAYYRRVNDEIMDAIEETR